MQYKLNEIAPTKIGLVLNRKKASLQSSIKRNYNVVSLKSFNDNGVYKHPTQEDIEEFVADSVLKEDYIVTKGDILVRLRTPNFAVCIDEDYQDLVVSSLMAIIRVKNEMILPQYLTFYLNSDFVKKQLSIDATSAAIKMVKVSDLQNLVIEVPSIQTQQLIVDTMNAFNQEEELLQRLISEKQYLKKSIFNTVIQGDK